MRNGEGRIGFYTCRVHDKKEYQNARKIKSKRYGADFIRHKFPCFVPVCLYDGEYIFRTDDISVKQIVGEKEDGKNECERRNKAETQRYCTGFPGNKFF